jgi:hypothetical protein
MILRPGRAKNQEPQSISVLKTDMDKRRNNTANVIRRRLIFPLQVSVPACQRSHPPISACGRWICAQMAATARLWIHVEGTIWAVMCGEAAKDDWAIRQNLRVAMKVPHESEQNQGQSCQLLTDMFSRSTHLGSRPPPHPFQWMPWLPVNTYSVLDGNSSAEMCYVDILGRRNFDSILPV